MPLSDPGDLEQNVRNFLVGQGYSTLTAPRPTLLIYNSEVCGFAGTRWVGKDCGQQSQSMRR